MKIAITGGHFEDAPGACFEDRCEFPTTHAWAFEIAQNMGDHGVLIAPYALRTKINAINNNADLAGCVEVHFNSATNSHGVHVGEGCEALYNPGSQHGRKLAVACNRVMEQHLHPSRGVKEGWYQMRVGGKKLAFLNETNVPACIIEPGFVHNFERLDELKSIVCKAVASALLEYLGVETVPPHASPQAEAGRSFGYRLIYPDTEGRINDLEARVTRLENAIGDTS